MSTTYNLPLLLYTTTNSPLLWVPCTLYVLALTYSLFDEQNRGAKVIELSEKPDMLKTM
jgi:hypothetical protein